MRLVHNHTAEDARGRRRALRLPPGLALLAATAWVAAGAAGAGAAVGLAASSPGAAHFCGVASGYRSQIDPATQITPSAATTSLATLESRMKTAFQKIKTEEPSIIGAAPTAIQNDLKDIFAVDNVLFGDLQKAHWNFLALAADEKTLQADEAKIAAPLAALKTYFTSQCHLTLG
jgi:hypothetical protein